MRNPLFLVVAIPALCLADSETKIKFDELPAAVQAAAKQQSQGATVRGYSREVEHGKTFYEAEMIVDGHSKDVSFDATGKVVSVEEEVSIDSIPAAARDAINKAAVNGKLQKVEAVAENGRSFYEASIKKGSKNSEMKFDANGTVIH